MPSPSWIKRSNWALTSSILPMSMAGRSAKALTEQIVGRWFAQGGGRREKVVIATKVNGRMGEWPNQQKLSALHIRQAVEGSLKRLQTDHIDLYQMHHIDRLTPWEEIWQAMEVLVQQGKIIYVGSSNSPAGISRKRRRSPKPGISWGWSANKVSTTWMPHGRTGSTAGLQGLRAGCHPVEPVVGWAAGRRTGKDREGPARIR